MVQITWLINQNFLNFEHNITKLFYKQTLCSLPVLITTKSIFLDFKVLIVYSDKIEKNCLLAEIIIFIHVPLIIINEEQVFFQNWSKWHFHVSFVWVVSLLLLPKLCFLQKWISLFIFTIYWKCSCQFLLKIVLLLSIKLFQQWCNQLNFCL